MTRLRALIRRVLRRPAAPEPEPPAPSRIIPVNAAGKEYVLEMHE